MFRKQLSQFWLVFNFLAIENKKQLDQRYK